MDRTVVVEAPAKINLHLQVLGKRPDGFHDIRSLFQAVSLSDTLEIRIRGSGAVRVFGDFDCPETENTMHRAVKSFLEVSGRPEGAEIRAVKRIPAGAGLGGGSSDAAAVLRALNRAFGDALSKAELSRLAAGVGSDVPFFLGTPCAEVGGRGDILEPAEPRTDYRLVILFPGFAIGTAGAYAAVDESRKASPSGEGGIRDSGRLREEYRKDPGTWTFRNDFFDALAPGDPELRRAKEALEDAGASFAGMTGSGSAFFGIFGSETAADRAARSLDGREGGKGRWSAAAAAPLARMPVPRLE